MGVATILIMWPKLFVQFLFLYPKEFSYEILVEIVDCYMTPIKGLLWLAETSLHWLWQIMMSNSDELKTLTLVVIADRELKIDWTKSSPGNIAFVSANRELK